MQGSLYKSLALTAGLTFGLAGFISGQTTYTYSTFSVPEAAPATEGSLSVTGINKAGDVAGTLTDASGDLKAFVRNFSTGGIAYLVNPLDTTTPTYTLGYSLNDLGVVAGIFYDTATSYYSGYLYSITKNTYYTINLPGEPAGSFTFVEGVNDLENFCGSVAAPPSYVYQAYLSIKGTVTIVTLPANTGAGCVGINDYNVAVGWYADANGVDHGWVRNPSTGAVTTFEAPGASTVPATVACWGANIAGTIADGINDSNAISGHYFDTNNLSHGFVVSGGKFTQLDVPGAFQTGGGGVNASGQVAGHYSSDSTCDNAGYIATPTSTATSPLQ
jgi:hypothetical protein